MKGGQKGSHLSTHCERPGGRNENFDLFQKVDSFLYTELPKRPNGDPPRQVRVNEVDRRSRSRSKSRGHHRRHAQEEMPPGFNPWDYGEQLEDHRRHALKALTSARKEMTDTGKISE